MPSIISHVFFWNLELLNCSSFKDLLRIWSLWLNPCDRGYVEHGWAVALWWKYPNLWSFGVFWSKILKVGCKIDFWGWLNKFCWQLCLWFWTIKAFIMSAEKLWDFEQTFVFIFAIKVRRGSNRWLDIPSLFLSYKFNLLWLYKFKFLL